MAKLTGGRALGRTTDLTQGALQDIDNVVAIIEASSMSQGEGTGQSGGHHVRRHRGSRSGGSDFEVGQNR